MQPNTQQQVVTEDFRILYRANAQGLRSAHDFDAAAAGQSRCRGGLVQLWGGCGL